MLASKEMSSINICIQQLVMKNMMPTMKPCTRMQDKAS